MRQHMLGQRTVEAINGLVSLWRVQPVGADQSLVVHERTHSGVMPLLVVHDCLYRQHAAIAGPLGEVSLAFLERSV